MTLAFVTPAHDRMEDLRREPAKLAELLASPRVQILRARGDQVEIVGEKPKISQTALSPAPIFLGLAADGAPLFAEQAPETAALAPLRGLMLSGALPHEDLTLLAQARSLVHWHETHGFCAKCGAPSEMADGGYRRHCPACKADHFPRTDPVVIICVTWNNHVLLGRQASWPEGMYSALAGFMEPGETIENAARREVWEEAGIRVGPVSYVQSQPWPFPASLMIGLVGVADSHEIRIDHHELQDARWFPFDEAKAMMARKHPQGLTATHPYAIAHHLLKTVLGD